MGQKKIHQAWVGVAKVGANGQMKSWGWRRKKKAHQASVVVLRVGANGQEKGSGSSGMRGRAEECRLLLEMGLANRD